MPKVKNDAKANEATFLICLLLHSILLHLHIKLGKYVLSVKKTKHFIAVLYLVVQSNSEENGIAKLEKVLSCLSIRNFFRILAVCNMLIIF